MENSPPIFISHSSQDKVIAASVCAALEADGSACWIAPRNIPFGKDWSEAIVEAIAGCRVLILLFSSHANASVQVRREVQRAFEHGVTVIPIRIEDIVPHPALEYYISSVHWLDAAQGLLPQHLQQLTTHIRTLLRGNEPAASTEAVPVFEAANNLSAPPTASASPPPAAQSVAQPASPVEAVEAPPTNLPEPTTSFVGREKEIDELSAILLDRSHRLITITGPGGTGKTRLSLQVAAECMAQYEQGVWLVELESVARAQDVPAAIALAIGIPLSNEGEAKVEILAYLRPRNCLLVLDNFEQVVDAARFVGDLLKQCPRVTIMISSREVLQIAGEQEYPLAPLALPPASVNMKTWMQYASLQLFVERCQSVRPSFAVVDTNIGDISEICRRLEGLPLALELTSALVRGMMPQQILPRLNDRLKVLASSRRDLDPRQRSMRGAIDWSYDLLSEDARALFAELSVFVGGFSLEAVEAVCESPDVFDLVFALRDKSLLRSLEIDGESRFLMMETLREYATEKRKQTDNTDLDARHAAYYLEQAEQWSEQLEGKGDAVQAQKRLQTDIDNMRAGMDWAVQQDDCVMMTAYGRALARFFLARGLHNEGDQRLATAEEACRRSNDNTTLALLLLQRGRIAFRQSHIGEAKRFYEESYAISKQAENTPRLVPPLINLGKVAWAESNFEEAKRIWEEGLALAQATKQPSYEATLLASLGILASDRGDFVAAANYFESSIGIHQRNQDDSSLAYALMNAGDALFRQKLYPAAYKKIAASRDLFTRLGRAQETALTSVHIGHIQIEQDQLDEAQVNIHEGLRVARETTDVWSEMYGLTAQGYLHGRRGDLPGAFTCYSSGLKLAQQLGDRKQTGDILESAGRSLERNGHVQEAYIALSMARSEFKEIKTMEAIELASLMETICTGLETDTIHNLDAKCGEYDPEMFIATMQEKFIRDET